MRIKRRRPGFPPQAKVGRAGSGAGGDREIEDRDGGLCTAAVMPAVCYLSPSR